MTRKITPDQARSAFGILVREAGVVDDATTLQEFVYHVAEKDTPSREHRFGGSLGFGGKFRNNGGRDGVPFVDCYPEDKTPERETVMARTNAALAQLFQ